MTHMVTIDGKGECFPCSKDMNVLAAMERSRCQGIPVGCRNGGCGACKVRVCSGHYETRKMNRAVLSEQEEREGCVLACRTYPREDIRVQVLGRVWQQAKPQATTSFSFGFSGAASDFSVSQPDKET